MKLHFGVLVGACWVLSGCTGVPGVGTRPGDIPPSLYIEAETGNKVWDNPSAFGPVPTALAEEGRAACGGTTAEGGRYKAIGYHPAATDTVGNPLFGGGYYCVEK